MVINSIIQQDIYSDKYPLNFQITNYNFQDKTEKFQYNRYKLGSYNHLFFNQNLIETIYFPLIIIRYINLKADYKTFDLDQNWYSGQIGIFEVNCDQCKTNVELNYNTVDTQKLLMDMKLKIQLNMMIIQKSCDLPNFQYQSNQTTVFEDNIVVYSLLCNNGTKFAVYATECFSITGCSLLGYQAKSSNLDKHQKYKQYLMSHQLFYILIQIILNLFKMEKQFFIELQLGLEELRLCQSQLFRFCIIIYYYFCC